MNKHSRTVSWVAAGAVAVALAGQLAGCAVAVVGGAVAGGALIATADGRRSSETAAIDDRIETQAGHAIELALAGRDHHVNVTSYYHKVLLTGEVVSDADRASVQAAVQGLPDVQGVFNDLAVMPPSSALSRSQDGIITSKVKTRFMHTNGVPAAAIKVLTERGTVYLMGRLTRHEAQTATDAVQQVGGVQRVARIIDFVPDTAITSGSSSTITGGSYLPADAADAPVSGGVNDVTAPPPAAAPTSTSSTPPAPDVQTHPIR